MKESDIILVYVTCENIVQAKKIGRHLMDKRLCACINIFSNIKSFSLWPPKTGKIEKAKEAVLIIKTLKDKFSIIEKEIYRIHTYKNPCIMALPIIQVSKKYYSWLKGEIK